MKFAARSIASGRKVRYANALGGQDTNLFADNGPHVFVVHAATR